MKEKTILAAIDEAFQSGVGEPHYVHDHIERSYMRDDHLILEANDGTQFRVTVERIEQEQESLTRAARHAAEAKTRRDDHYGRSLPPGFDPDDRGTYRFRVPR